MGWPEAIMWSVVAVAASAAAIALFYFDNK